MLRSWARAARPRSAKCGHCRGCSEPDTAQARRNRPFHAGPARLKGAVTGHGVGVAEADVRLADCDESDVTLDGGPYDRHAGGADVRAAFYAAANAVLMRSITRSNLKAWGMRLMKTGINWSRRSEGRHGCSSWS